ncbi:MAG: prepilin-type N-terminal cleavage/methylation domain-containing protein [Phycisphaera sp.]|nr:prepilin-type N-terminal cleavage/methylation domain-containing protein [Phycisphaera sp.]
MRHAQTRSTELAPRAAAHRIHRDGFTIVELLVVMSIILLLLSIMMPSFSKVREVSRRAICASNLHQTHTGHVMWAGDHYNQLIGGQPFIMGTGFGCEVVWARGINRPEPYGDYLREGVLARDKYVSGQTLYCPSWQGPPEINYEQSGWWVYGGWVDDLNQLPASISYMATHYDYNSMVGSDVSSDPNDWRPARMSDPGRLALMADQFVLPVWGGVAHNTGYSTAHLDGSVNFYDDPTRELRDFNGPDYNYWAGYGNYVLYQSKAWQILSRGG